MPISVKTMHLTLLATALVTPLGGTLGCGGLAGRQDALSAAVVSTSPLSTPPLSTPAGPAGAHPTATPQSSAACTDCAPAKPALEASPHLPFGVPTDATPADDIWLDRGGFVLSYDGDRRTPNWVAWRLRKEDIGSTGRAGRFHTDTLLPAGLLAVTPEDYRGTGFDRGHLCPSAHRTHDVTANQQTFLMSNMQPQTASLNRGPWKKLETLERRWAQQDDTSVYIVAGGLFTATPRRIGPEPGIAVPRAAYRITVVLTSGGGAGAVSANTRVVAAVLPNTEEVRGVAPDAFLSSVDSVEAESGYDFLAAVSDDVERVLEARVGTLE